MGKLLTFGALGTLAVAAAGIALWPSSERTEAVTLADSTVRQPSLLAAGSHAQEADHEIKMPGFCQEQECKKSETAREPARIAEFVGNKGILRAAAQEAIASKDPVRLQYARMYIDKCQLMTNMAGARPWTRDHAQFERSSPAMAKAMREFNDFCGDLGTSGDRNLKYALGAAAKAAGSATLEDGIPSTDQALAELKRAKQAGAAEMLIEQLPNLRGEANIRKWLIESGVASEGDIKDVAMFSAFEQVVLPGAACSAMGCNEAFERMKFCVRDRWCSDEHANLPLEALYAAKYRQFLVNNYGSADAMPSWQQVRDRAVNALRR